MGESQLGANMSSIHAELGLPRRVGLSALRWRWPMVVFGMVGLVVAMQIALVWSLLTWSVVRTETLLTASETRHQAIVGELKQAIVNAAQSHSAELSPVRIRLRVDEGRVNTPFGRWLVAIARVGSDGVVGEPVRGAPMDGTVDFGYRAVGRYVLTISDGARWELKHEFEVWPGAPFDRVVRVPLQLPDGQKARLQLVDRETQRPEAGPGLGSGRVAVCELRPAEVTLDGWKWTPGAKQRVYAMIGDVQGEERELLLEEFVARYVGEFSEGELPILQADGLSAFEVKTCGYQLASVTLCELDGPTGERPGLVARTRWIAPDVVQGTDGEEDVATIRGSQPVAWQVSGLEFIATLPLVLPRELVLVSGASREEACLPVGEIPTGGLAARTNASRQSRVRMP
jgi:hypothetical protein